MKKKVLEKYHLENVTEIKDIPKEIKSYYSSNKMDITGAFVDCLTFEVELIHTEQIELSRCMTNLGNQIYQIYTTIVLQFGYLMLFSLYFPVSVFACYITNLIIIGLFIRSLNTHIRRTLSRNIQSITIWNTVINFLGYLSVFYNVFSVLLPIRRTNILIKDLDEFLLWEIAVGSFGLLIFLKYCIEKNFNRESRWYRKEKLRQTRLQVMEKVEDLDLGD